RSVSAEEVPDVAEGVPESRTRGNRSGSPQSQNGAVADRPDGQNKPCPAANSVIHQKINLGRLVGNGLAAPVAERKDPVASTVQVGCGFYLHTPKPLTGVDDEIVTFVVTVGLGHDKAQARCFVDKGQFG